MQDKEKYEKVELGFLDTLNYLKKQGLSSDEIIELINKLLRAEVKEEVEVPINVFNNDYLSSLETIVKYMRENLLLSFSQIAALTNRNELALAVSYRNARRKLKSKFIEEKSPYYIQVSILKDRNLSVLENIVAHLKDTYGFTYHQIAVMLNRDDRTIWTVYNRAKKKNNKIPIDNS